MNHFPKGERLKSRKKILALLNEGNIVKAGPIKTIWAKDKLQTGEEDPVRIQAAFSVPKRKFKQAEKRNRIRRKMKEVFRLNKHILNDYLAENDYRINLIVIYLSNKDLPYKQIEKHFIKALNAILESLKFENVSKYK